MRGEFATLHDMLRYVRSLMRSLRWDIMDAAQILPNLDCDRRRIFFAVTASVDADLTAAFQSIGEDPELAPPVTLGEDVGKINHQQPPTPGLRGVAYSSYARTRNDLHRLKSVTGVMSGQGFKPIRTQPFSVVLVGFFKPRASGVHRFYIASNDYAYVWLSHTQMDPRRAVVGINGSDVDRGIRESHDIALIADEYYPFTLWYGHHQQTFKLQVGFTDPESPKDVCYNFTGLWFSIDSIEDDDITEI